MAININREVEDAFYRYKMPKLQAKVEGKGNGIKTVIVNVSEIAKSLYRKPIYVTKYFGCELGAQVNVDEKNDRYIVNGAHEADKLQQLLDGFIKKFVLCPGCGNPETDLTVKKKAEIVKSTCKACGCTKTLDARHRLTQFIIKNPPADEVSKTKCKSKNSKPENSDEDDEEQASPSTMVAANIQHDDEDWGEDTTEEAQRQRMEELSDMAKALALSSDVEKSKKERAQIFFTTVSDFYTKGTLLAKLDYVIQEADRLDLGARSVLVVVEVVLNEPDKINDNLKKFAPLFAKLIAQCDNPNRAQLNMLNAIVTLADTYPDLIKKTPVYVKCMYDFDITEEEVILQWAAKGASNKYSSKTVHEQVLSKCEVFFNWLREADEESSDSDNNEEDEEEDDDDDVSDGEKENEQNLAMANTKLDLLNRPSKINEVAKINDDDDDLDIDAI